jgi:DNA polymerase eta
MLASKNLIPPCTTPLGGLPWLSLLSGELSLRLLEARDLSPNLWPKTLVLSWRTGYGYGNNLKSRQMAFGYNKVVSLEYIEGIARKLWEGACRVIELEGKAMDVFSVSGGGEEE